MLGRQRPVDVGLNHGIVVADMTAFSQLSAISRAEFSNGSPVVAGHQA
ncbi:hypothetical protein KDV70_24350 [Citrobacter cronae]